MQAPGLDRGVRRCEIYSRAMDGCSRQLPGCTDQRRRVLSVGRQFVSIYQIARSLPEYVGSFLDMDKHNGHFDFDEVLKSRNAASQSGGGWDAPPLTRTLGIGACFVTRELVRIGVLRSRHAHDHAYVGTSSVRNVFVRLGMADLSGETAGAAIVIPRVSTAFLSTTWRGASPFRPVLRSPVPCDSRIRRTPKALFGLPSAR